ncbi:MAG: antitoxin VbhA family protein [Zoogloeaceae bacterium]|jgi:hypothetical protein|nr:antitoxin VbhA family protein [Zoogloeaceae bacterium]
MKPTRAEIQEAADQALANVMLEGFVPDAEFMQLRDRHIKGEISDEEFRAIVIKQVLEEDHRLETRKQHLVAA